MRCSGTAGNPNIDPYRATQEDLSLEWYPNKDTAYTIALYNKNLKNFIVDNPTTQILPFAGQTAPSALCTTVSAQPVQLSVRDQRARQRRLAARCGASSSA